MPTNYDRHRNLLSNDAGVVAGGWHGSLDNGAATFMVTEVYIRLRKSLQTLILQLSSRRFLTAQESRPSVPVGVYGPVCVARALS